MRRALYFLIAGFLLGQVLPLGQAFAGQRPVVKSASEYDYPPFCIITKEGKADGFSVQLLREALAAVDLDVDFQTGEWDQIKKDLAVGSIQVLPLVGRTPEREAFYDFTFPYLTLHGAVFVREDDTRINKVSDLADKAVMVLRGDNAEEFARRTHISSNIITVDSYTQAMQWLAVGKYDAVIAQRVMGLQLLNATKIKNVHPLELSLQDFRQDFCFAVRKGDKALLSQLNEGLSIVIANKTFDQLYKKWFGALLKQQVTFQDVGKYLSIILIPVMAVMVLVWIVLLRLEVKRKTKSLVDEMAEHKRIDAALQESRERYASTLAALDDGLWDWHIPSGKAFFNAAYYSILGYEDGAFSADYDTWRKFVHPDDIVRVEEGLRCAHEAGKGFDIDLRMKMRSGEWLWVATRGKTIESDADGKAVRMVGTLSNITERKRSEDLLRMSERRYRNLITSLDAGIVVHAPDSSVVMSNARASELLGLSEEQMRGKMAIDPQWRFVHEDHTPFALEDYPVNRIIASMKEFKKLILGIDRPATHDMAWVEVNGLPVLDSQGGLSEIIISFVDITERKHADNILQKAKEDAEAASKAKTEFLNNIAHDFRTPMHAIMGFSGLLKAEALTEKQEHFVRVIYERSRSLLGLVEDLLSASRLETGHLELRHMEFDIKKCLASAVDVARIELGDKNVKVSLDAGVDIPRIQGDESRFNQILINLVGNAVKYTDKGEIVVKLSVDHCSDAKCRIRVSVKDTGFGIAPDKQQRVFNAFTRFHEFEGGQERSGVGLGMYITKRLVDLMHGEIGLVSEVGVGSEFVVTLDFDRV
ncbi:MAG: transporter substrate-binding domain-containing protein [Candidatus Omnitrophica bacterium]|nr:transporter substrate-binding domain-containing protein [Candidatus Omnitrophota bacterium]